MASIQMNQDLIPIISPWINRVLLYMSKMYIKGQYNINPEMIANIHRAYIALIAGGNNIATPVKILQNPKYPLITWDKQTYGLANSISAKTGISKLIVLMFFTALYDLSRKGKISMKKYDPVGVELDTDLQQSIEKPWWLQVGKMTSGTLKTVPLVLIAGTVFGLMYLTKGAKRGS